MRNIPKATSANMVSSVCLLSGDKDKVPFQKSQLNLIPGGPRLLLQLDLCVLSVWVWGKTFCLVQSVFDRIVSIFWDLKF